MFNEMNVRHGRGRSKHTQIRTNLLYSEKYAQGTDFARFQLVCVQVQSIIPSHKYQQLPSHTLTIL